MKRLLVTGSIVAALAVVFAMQPGTTRSLSTENRVTDEQIAAIKTHCLALQASLNQLHQTDTLLRLNRGKLYQTMVDKLMSPLNQRIASNQLDGSRLVKTTASFNQTYQDFKKKYSTYEVALGEVLKTDCTRQPSIFYSRLADARKKRQDLGKVNQQLVAGAEEYQTEFAAFRKKIAKEAE